MMKNPYVTSWERMAKEEGKLEGQLEGERKALRATIAETIELRFGALPENLATWVNGISDLAQLRALQRQAVTCSSLNTFAESLSLAE